MSEKNQFYSLTEILKKKATYNVIFGERSNGKTYGALKYAIESYFKTGGTLAIVRRYKEDITGKRASDIFNAINVNGEVEKISGGKFTGITYYAGKCYFCTYDDNGKAIYNDSNIFCYLFSLSETEHNKSISYPTITTIVFDEFLTRKMYFPDEFVLFMNTVSTIVRQRTNVKIFMLGNTVNKYCPYFSEMGLNHVLSMEQGTIDLYTYGESQLTVAVEYCASTFNKKANNFYFAFDNPKLHMITSGAWELDIYPHLPVKYKPKDIQLIYFIIFNDVTYQCEIIKVDGEYFTYIHAKTTEIKDADNAIIYTLAHNHKMNYCRNIFKPTLKIGEKIIYFFNKGKVFYQNNEIGDAINNYLKICKTM